MRFRSRTTVDIHPGPGSLTVRIQREQGWLDWLLMIAMLCVCLWQAYRLHSIAWLGFVFFAVVAVIASQARGATTELVVTGARLVAHGNVGRWSPSEIAIDTSDISAMRYQSGEDDSSSGLYVKHGWKNTCLLSNINKQQTNEILSEIFRCFQGIGDQQSRSSILRTARS
jgi:hypothetical protein